MRVCMCVLTMIGTALTLAATAACLLSFSFHFFRIFIIFSCPRSSSRLIRWRESFFSFFSSHLHRHHQHVDRGRIEDLCKCVFKFYCQNKNTMRIIIIINIIHRFDWLSNICDSHSNQIANYDYSIFVINKTTTKYV